MPARELERGQSVDPTSNGGNDPRLVLTFAALVLVLILLGLWAGNTYETRNAANERASAEGLADTWQDRSPAGPWVAKPLGDPERPHGRQLSWVGTPLMSKLMLAGALISGIGSIWLIVVGFSVSAVWGIGILIFNTAAILLFAALHWDEARTPFMIWALGAALLIVGFPGL
jgi:hypothetical protein